MRNFRTKRERRQKGEISAKLKSAVFACAISAICFSACDEPQPPQSPAVDPSKTAASGVYALCEVRFDMNNGYLDNNYFLTADGRGPGDTGNDLKAYGSKLHYVVNNSETGMHT